jgi:phosphonate transport system ATP-binding protein
MLLQLTNENLGYKQGIVLRNVSLSIHKGERVVLVGGSGAGKSTLLSQLHKRFHNKVALIPQDAGLVSHLSVFHNIYMGRLNQYSTGYNLLNLAWPQKRVIDEMRSFVQMLGMDDKLFKKTGELSGGQQQRTAVCRALYQGGGAVIGDEPVSALDHHKANDVMQALCDRFETVVLALHDVELALKYATRIIGIKQGEIAFDQPTTKLSRSDLDFLYVG